MLKRSLLAAVLLAGLAVPAAHGGDDGAPCSWPMFGHDLARSFATPDGCSTISNTSAPTLAPKWYFPAPDAVSASPAIVDGHVYVGDWAGNFYALNATTGEVEWTFVVGDTSAIGFGRIVSSAAVTDVGGRRIVVFGGGATLYALDATSGEEVNHVCVDPRTVDYPCQVHDGQDSDQVEIESSPAIVTENDGSTSVVVGMDVHNGEGVGRAGVIKFALTSGGLTPTWKFDPDADVAYSDPTMLIDGAGSGSGCADVWGSPAVDVGNGLVFFGTGSCDHEPAADDVGEHMWAVALDDGHQVWKYGPHKGMAAMVDDDFGGALNLLPDGLVGGGSKDGTYYAIDRVNGPKLNPETNEYEPEWATHVGQYGHASDGFAVGGVLASPATGMVGDEPAVFIATAISTPNDRPIGDGPDSAVPTVTEDPQRMFSLHAISAKDGHILWRSYISRQAYGPPTYANGVVFVPSTFDFSLVAVDADSGLTLAQRPLAGPPSSAPTALGDTVYGGVGTSTAEGSPLAPLSGVYAFSVVGG